MNGINTIQKDGKIFAIVVSRKFDKMGPTFLTPEDFPFQMGVVKYGKDHFIRTHRHRPFSKPVNSTQEFLAIVEGRLEVSIYTDAWEMLEVVVLEAGDCILLAAGGHGMKFLEETKLVEAKQGPYTGVTNEKAFMDEETK